MDMRKLLNIASGLLLESDADHRDALEKTGFWGKQGAGCLFLAKDTGRFCIAHRSPNVEQPNTWGTWGGAIDSGENPKDAVQREVNEEAGYHGPLELIPLYVFKHTSGFRYYNFLAVVETEFTPVMDWETQGFEWCKWGEWPDPLHPGMTLLLKDPRSVSIMQDMSVTHQINEGGPRKIRMRMHHVCTIKTNFPDADFWIQPGGTKEDIGRPTKKFNPEYIGIKLDYKAWLAMAHTNGLWIDSKYLYSLFMMLHSEKKWESVTTGSLSWSHGFGGGRQFPVNTFPWPRTEIDKSDIGNIPIGGVNYA